MKKSIFRGLFLTCLTLAVLSCGKEKSNIEKESKSEKKEVVISIAASTKKAVDTIVKNYKKENPNVEININSGGSGALQQQIEGGAPVDIFLSASKKNMDTLEEKGLLDNATRKDLLKNELVLIGEKSVKDKIKNIDQLKTENVKIALGELSTVPAGKYAKQAFEKLGIWNDIEKKVIYQKDVTAVMNIVDAGEIEVGVVYSSDALELKNGFVIAVFKSEDHDPIVYPIALIKDSKNKEEALKFLEYLSSEKSLEIFKENGFKY
ncbi:MAG: molybdate ABC transporter substrate-binding protein [Sebaldella sp.]|nr:molybdate ABC transporter substrate-binding protein [Sebaldella sp.]